jgi:1-hydroxy-2-methyl-2-(E)-butenyl 4-diphosphate synthase
MITRRKTRQIQLAGLMVGGGAPITVQSMTKTDTRNVEATLLEIWSLEAAGCDIVRCAVPVKEAAEKLGEIKRQIRIPLVADIHFNYKLALIALEQGVDGLRLNPGNIGGKGFVQEVVNLAKEKRIPIRIGVNAGSLEKDLLAKYNGPSAAGMVESALRHIHILEDLNYPEMKISLKASDPLMMIEAYRMLADKVEYAFHLGVTEAGTPGVGTIKSAIGLGALLSEGIGDTIRVSLSADPAGRDPDPQSARAAQGRSDLRVVSVVRARRRRPGQAREGGRGRVQGVERGDPHRRDGMRGQRSGRGTRRRHRRRGGPRHRAHLQERGRDPQSARERDRPGDARGSRQVHRRAQGREDGGCGGPVMGQYKTHVFVCTSGDSCPTQGNVEQYVKFLRDESVKAGLKADIRINKAGCFSQCGHGPMMVFYPENVWYGGVQESDLKEIFESHIRDGKPVARLVYDPGVKGANKKPGYK